MYNRYVPFTLMPIPSSKERLAMFESRRSRKLIVFVPLAMIATVTLLFGPLMVLLNVPLSERTVVLAGISLTILSVVVICAGAVAGIALGFRVYDWMNKGEKY